jgi:predicted DNA-binding ribbon-helix-helix protein
VTRGTTRRTVRIEDALWVPALTIAKRRGENLSDIIRAALQAYIDKHQGEK